MAEIAPAVPTKNYADTQRYELTLGDYWRILLKRRYVVVLTFFSVLISSIVYTNLQTPLYRADAAVRIAERAKAFQYNVGAFYSSFGDTMATRANNVTSQQVIERVVLRLGLLAPDARSNDLAMKVEEIRSSIEAKQEGMTDVIRITVIYPVPELAASIANETARAYVEIDLFEKTKEARNLRQFVEQQLVVFSKKLRITEERIKEFRETGRALGIAIGLEKRLADLEKDRNQLLKQFTEQHPDVVKLQVSIEDVKKKIRELPAEELELARLQRELEINDRAYRMMKEKYETAKLAEAEEVSDVVVTETASTPHYPISPKKNLNKLLGALIGLLLGVLFAFGLESIDTSIGTIEDVERTVRLPVIGVVPYYNPRARRFGWWPFDMKLLDMATGRKDAPPDSSFLIMNQDAFSNLSEAYKILRTFIEFLMEKGGSPKPGGKVLLFTSTGPQEGKSLTAANLAIAFAQAGKKTLLVDADLRRPTIHWLFGLKRNPGLTDVLLGTSSFSEGRRTMGDILIGEASKWDKMMTTKMLDRLEIMATGSKTHNPAELLSSAEYKNFLEKARLQYEYIMIDSPPVLPVTDARTIGMMADATFFIYRAGKTARRALTRAKDELDLAGVSVKGIILNYATPEVTLTDSYYTQYYGEKKDREGA
ncbi:MAG: AAA family ATPase [Candidatus Omnitrophica bacterium]|nr:AAA family ATPase [Candidatus Omnitrophota bacterium]